MKPETKTKMMSGSLNEEKQTQWVRLCTPFITYREKEYTLIIIG
jgi:hypothetical protein